MNLLQFLKKVDENIAELTREELEAFIHEFARNLPENGRDNFLENIRSIKVGTSAISSSEKEEGSSSELYLNIEKCKEILAQIASGDRCLNSEYNEAWDDWYHSDEEEFVFSDPEHLLDDIEGVINLIHICIDTEKYKEGLVLAELLSGLTISITGDYMDYDDVFRGIGELYDHALLHGSFEDVVKESLFLAYMGNELSVRPEAFCRMMENYQCFDVSLEHIMQMGNQALPRFHEFLPLWIDYLGNQEGKGVKKLLLEAQAMQEDKGQLLETARKFVDKHPELYLQILQAGADDVGNDKMLQVGMEAMEKIPVSYVIRSEIALLAAEYAYLMGKEDAMEFCQVEAFRSETSVLNYIRIRYGARDWRKYEKEIRQIYDDVYEQTKQRDKESLRHYQAGAQRENTLRSNQYYALLFFEGEFDKVLAAGMNETRPLGWSCTFMKQGLAMFLLLMYEGEGLPKGLDAMLTLAVSGCGFQAEEFVKGIHVGGEKNSRELFWDWFCKWKSEMDISMENSAKWMEKMQQLVSMRTAGIMDANRRNYYGECAAFIAACGEVLESKGRQNAKAYIMEKYKSEYSRRRAFHQELRAFGMKK